MTRGAPLASFASAVTPLVVLLAAACVGAPGQDPAGASPSPTGAPDPTTTTTPPDPPPPPASSTASASTPPTCGSWNGRDFFATASADLVQECLQAGAPAHDPSQPTPAIFGAAARATDPRVIHLLVDAGADLDAALGQGIRRTGYRHGYTPLHTAAALNPNPGIIDVLVSAGADPNARDRDGSTPLHTAWTNPNPAVVRALLRTGADPLARNERGQAADPTSCMNWTTAAFARLALPEDFRRCLALGEDIQAYDGDGDTSLHLAVEVGNAEALRILLEAGADLSARNNAGAAALHMAATNESAEIFTLLLEAGADVNAGAGSFGTPLLSAIVNRRGFRRGPMNEAAVNALLDAGADVNAADSDGNTPLLASMDPDRRKGSLNDLPMRLLSLGADPNRPDGQGRTPLYAAAAAEGPEVIHALLAAGADPQVLTNDGASPLHAAAGSGRPEVITLLASIGLDPDVRSVDGIVPLHLAVERNNTNRGQSVTLEIEGDRPSWALAEGDRPPWVLRALALLEAGADPHARNAEGDTPLHLSVWHGDSTLVSAFVLAGADVHARNDSGETPLHAARAWDSRPAVRALLRLGADPDALDNSGLAADPVCWGAGPVYPWQFLARSPAESVRGCLETGIPVDSRDSDGATFLARMVSAVGCCSDFENVLAAFVEAGADVNTRDNEGRTPLHRALAGRGDRSARRSVISALLGAGADPNARDSQGSTPLHTAAAEWWDASALVSLLAAAGANLNARNSAGDTPLHVALRGGVLGDDVAFVRALLQFGADPMARDSAGKTADPVACERWGNRSFFALADAAIVADCIDGGASVQAVADRFLFATPSLHAAGTTRDPAVISVLLEAGADVQGRDEFRAYTPLHLAAEKGTSAIVRALLQAGADADAWATGFSTDWGWGWTPLHLAARSNPDPDVITALVEAGADLHAPGGESYRRGNTPLHYAGENPNPAVAAALLDAGAEVNAHSRAGRTPLHEAAANASNPAVVDLLVAAGADVNARDAAGYTPLHSAAWYNPRPEIATALLAAGADVNARHPDGYVPSGLPGDDRSPLFMAVYRGGIFVSGQPMPTGRSAPVVEVLVSAGANLEQTDGSGLTPLHAAARWTPAAYPLLLRLGADPNARDADGKTPLDYALENRSLEGLPEVLRLREAMRGRR